MCRQRRWSETSPISAYRELDAFLPLKIDGAYTIRNRVMGRGTVSGSISAIRCTLFGNKNTTPRRPRPLDERLVATKDQHNARKRSHVGHWLLLFRPKPHVVFQKNDIRVPRDFVKSLGVGPSRNEDDDTLRRSRQPLFVGLPHEFRSHRVGWIYEDGSRLPFPREPIIFLKILSRGGDQRVRVRTRIEVNPAKDMNNLFDEIRWGEPSVSQICVLSNNGFPWPDIW